MNFLEKIRSLSEPKKKIIAWSMVVLLAVPLLFLWWLKTSSALEKLKNMDLRIPPIPSEDLNEAKGLMDSVMSGQLAQPSIQPIYPSLEPTLEPTQTEISD